MAVYVSKFFAPTNPKRPVNFVVIKYFLMGLLISNAIESILIIHKILDVLDQTEIQAKELDRINIKKEEVQEMLAVEQKVQQLQEREQQRQLNVLLKEKASEPKSLGDVAEQIRKAAAGAEEEYEKKQEEEHSSSKHHKNHNNKKAEHETGRHHEEETTESDQEYRNKHPEVRKRPQRLQTAANPVALFMLFYGSVTLCLGATAVFRESALLLAILIGVSVLGIVILISAGFSLIMIMSCSKDIIIAILSYKYREMVVTSDSPLPTAVNVATGDIHAGNQYDPNLAAQMPQQVSY